MIHRRSSTVGAIAIVAVTFSFACEVTSTPRGTAAPQSSTEVTVPTATQPQPTSTTAPSSTATVAPEGTGQAKVPPALEGKWESPSCGSRKYPRVITFDKTGTFHADDLISPCPPNVDCVWSGIVSRQGKYAVSGTTITLTVEGPATSGPGALPFPATLDLAPTPIEVVDGLRCGYRQVAATPGKK